MPVLKEWLITKENASNLLNVHPVWKNIPKGQHGKMKWIHVSSIFAKIALFDLLNTDVIHKYQTVANMRDSLPILLKNVVPDTNANATKKSAPQHQPVPKVSSFLGN